MIELGPNRYGKQAIRLVKVTRGPDGHVVRDLTVGVTLEGDFASAHTEGDNSLVVATDTMKNTVYAMAADHLTGAIEAFASVLAAHFVRSPQVERAAVSIREHRWEPLEAPGGRSPTAFRRSGGATRTATVTAADGATVVEGGVEELVVMKTADSAFTGFERDRFTTLPERSERIMATKITATWRYGSPPDDWDERHDSILGTLLEVFAAHQSESVQHSIWIIGQELLRRHAEIDEVRMVLPNLHHWPIDLTAFGNEDRGEIFVATTEPHGLIDATVRRSG
jgi:urate oxidase